MQPAITKKDNRCLAGSNGVDTQQKYVPIYTIYVAEMRITCGIYKGN